MMQDVRFKRQLAACQGSLRPCSHQCHPELTYCKPIEQVGTDQTRATQDVRFERRQLKEREQEDHLFEDKEKFVTSAYRRKLEEDQKWVDEQKIRCAVEEGQERVDEQEVGCAVKEAVSGWGSGS